MTWPIPCDYCDHIADSRDSYGDTRADLAVHVHLTHPGKPLPGTWTVADVRSIPGVVARERVFPTSEDGAA